MPFESEVKKVVFTIPEQAVRPLQDCNHPPQGGGSNHITLFRELIENTPNKGKIRVCISHFDHPDIAEALIRAGRRGVSVNIIKEVTLTPRFFDLFDDRGTVSIAYVRGAYGIKIHTKLFLFSRTSLDGEMMRHVVATGSATITESAETKHQDTFVVSDEQLYMALRNYFQQMLRHQNSAAYMVMGSLDEDDVEFPDPQDVFSTSGRVKAYLFPRSSDAVANIIGNVSGEVNRKTGDRPRIRVAMARWTERRPRILEEIVASLRRGCAVDLVLRFDAEDDWGVKRSIIDELIELRDSDNFRGQLSVKLANGAEEKTNVHNKYFLIEGHYGDGTEWETNVWSGSENWTSPALNYNDEIMVKFRDVELHRLYVEHHKGLQCLCVDNPEDIA